ncbi:hypothetical protein MHC_06022 [Mycoplasma haemocanis str. Illinois]|uniref:Uncharacterized protein n=1 Tax=Mycoplasma haemocanis (strain Illinois) TaxID=1111676 RepID=I6R7P0_MYCHN|nr:hypothetical protein MHC_06022 [Mycoplasma haemocanis str. Illinois]
MFLHYLVASAFQTLVPLVSSSFVETSNISEVGYADVANRYVSLKYSNNYLRFWDDASEHYSLRARKTQVIYSDSKAANFFKKVKGSNGEGWWFSAKKWGIR